MYGVTRKLFVLAWMAIVIFIVVLFVTDKNEAYKEEEQRITEYTKGWKAIKDVDNKKDSISLQQITNILPADLKDGGAISFYAKNQYVEVYVEDRSIYSFSGNKVKKTEIPGSRWHFSSLCAEDAGKRITINLWGESKDNVISQIFLGDKAELLAQRILKNSISFMASLLFCAIGIIIVIAWYIRRKKVDKKMLYIGLIILGTAAWSLIQTQVLQLLIGYSYEMSIIRCFLILLIQYPVIRYAVESYGTSEGRTFETLLNIYIGSVLLVTLGVGFGIINIREIEVIAHMYSWLCGVFTFILMGNGLRIAPTKRRKQIYNSMMIFVLFIIIYFIDFFSYEYFGLTDGARYTRWMIFLCGAMLAYEVLAESIRLVGIGKESEKIKNIAYNDALTCMGNRSAFLEKIQELDKQDYHRYGIAMFDLNNLKVFNDEHGHSAGDYYLIISSEILQDIFGCYGNIYRIGGDEFCAVLKDFSEGAFDHAAREMYTRISMLKGPYTKEKMSIAFGYQRFDESIDRDLNTTTDRADACMYKNKTKIKQDLKDAILVSQ